MRVMNTGLKPFHFTAALHTYIEARRWQSRAAHAGSGNMVAEGNGGCTTGREVACAQH